MFTAEEINILSSGVLSLMHNVLEAQKDALSDETRIALQHDFDALQSINGKLCNQISASRNLVTMVLPTRPGMSNEDTFLDIIDTFMGQYDYTVEPYSAGALGTWLRHAVHVSNNAQFRVAYIEDLDGNIIEYFVIQEAGGKDGELNTIVHRVV